jgi:hypothetical protein
MVDTIDRRGLKKRWLGKHKKAVDRFFASLIPTPSRTELAEAYRQKLLGRGLEMGRDFGLFVGRGGFSVGRCSGLRA